MRPFEASLARFSYSKILSKPNSKNQSLHDDSVAVLDLKKGVAKKNFS